MESNTRFQAESRVQASAELTLSKNSSMYASDSLAGLPRKIVLCALHLPVCQVNKGTRQNLRAGMRAKSAPEQLGRLT
jgi:hypothetical protein